MPGKIFVRVNIPGTRGSGAFYVKFGFFGIRRSAPRSFRIIPAQSKSCRETSRQLLKLEYAEKKPALPENPAEGNMEWIYASYNKVTVEGAAASRVFFHLKAEAVRMGE